MSVSLEQNRESGRWLEKEPKMQRLSEPLFCVPMPQCVSNAFFCRGCLQCVQVTGRGAGEGWEQSRMAWIVPEL